MSELVSSWRSLKATSDAEGELIASEQQKVGAIHYSTGHGWYILHMQYEELCKAIGSLIGAPSNDSVELLHALEQVVQVCI